MCSSLHVTYMQPAVVLASVFGRRPGSFLQRCQLRVGGRGDCPGAGDDVQRAQHAIDAAAAGSKAAVAVRNLSQRVNYKPLGDAEAGMPHMRQHALALPNR